MKKILIIIGCARFIGFYLSHKLSKKHNIIGTIFNIDFKKIIKDTIYLTWF